MRAASNHPIATTQQPGAATGIRHRVGLVGAGYICEYHVSALRRTPGVEIVGIHDLNQERAQALATRLNLKVFPSLAALKEHGANVIHVLTPPHTHARVTLDALDLGCHVLVEKPLAVDAEECEQIEKRAAATGLQVCVNHSLLFDPQVRGALNIARSGKLGKVISVDILRSSVYPPFSGGPLPPQYQTAGYPFRDLGVHCLYLMEAFLGPIDDVQAAWTSLGGDANLAFDEWRSQVRCRDGLGQFQLSWNVKPLQSQIIIQGTRGVLRADLFLMFRALRASTPLPKAAERIINAMTDSIQPLIDVPRNVYGFLRKHVLPYHGLHELVKEFYRALDSGKPVPVSVGDAKRVVQWVEQIARQADEEHLAKVKLLTVSQKVPYLVTGASGGLGSAVVERLRSEGKRVRLLVRRVPDQLAEGTEIVLGDLGDPQAVDRAVNGAETVIHVGAAMKGGWLDHERATIAGTQNVLDACVRHGVRKLVHVSSLSVIDWAGGRTGEPVTESSPLEPRAEERGSYTRAKLEAERLVKQFQQQHSLPVVILRPGQIFGGRIPLMTGAVARKLGKRWLILGNGELPLPLIHIDDVVDAIVRAADSPLAGGEIIQLVSSEALTQNEVLKLVAGPKARVVHVPRFMLFAGGRFSEMVLGLLKRQSPIARYRLRSALAIRKFQGENAHLLEGWSPKVNLRDAIVGTYVPASARPKAQTDREAHSTASTVTSLAR